MASSAAPLPTSRTSRRRSPPRRSSRRLATSCSTSAATNTTASTSSPSRSSPRWTSPAAWTTGRHAAKSSWRSPITRSSSASFRALPPPHCPKASAAWPAGQKPAASARAASSRASRSIRICRPPGPQSSWTSRSAPARPAEGFATDILFVTPWFPYPATNGARVRSSKLLAGLAAAGHHVSRLDDGRFIKILDGCEPFAFQSPVDTIRSQARIWKFKHFLRQMLNGVDAYVAVSDAELRWIRDEVGPQRAWGCTVPNGAEIAAPFEGPADRSRVIYTGSLTYRANLETVDYFLAQIWPSILKGQPGARFVNTGQAPDPQTVRRLQAVPGVSLAGLVSDYERFVSSSGVLAVPLLRGGGTRIKVLEGFALGCPVVATSKAVEGLNVCAGRDVLVADTPAAFAAAVLSLMTDDRLRRRLIDNARLTAARYSWTSAQQTFVEAVGRCVEQRAFLQPA